MDDNVEDCPVCLTTFDGTLRRPRNLPCGHTLCSPCINELVKQGAVTCPTCRLRHALPESGQFPICYAVEGLIRKMKELASVSAKPGKQPTAPAPVTRPAPRATAGLGRKTQSLLQEQEAKVLAAIRSCQEEQRQLAEYRTTLGEWGGRQQRLEDELLTLVEQSKGAREVMCREDSQVERRQEEVQRREEALHTVLQAMRTPATRQEAYDVIEEAHHLLEEDEERVAVFPDVHVVTTVARVAEASSAALQAAAAATQTALEAAGTAVAAGDSSFQEASATTTNSIKDRLEAMLAPPPPPSITAEDLLSLTQPARVLVEAGLVLAVQDVKGQSRHARISLEHGRLHLNSLQALATPPPPRTITLQVGEVLPAAPPCEVFLDLWWPGSAARRVVVSLPRDTPLGRQFVLLCSGQRGACYANTTLFEVWDKGQPGECVLGGDYETGKGRGGAALLPDLGQGDEYWRSGKAGAVWWWGWWDIPARGALFGITTRDCRPGGGGVGDVFGEVVDGLQVVKEAAQHRRITEVTVVQCGVLLSPH